MTSGRIIRVAICSRGVFPQEMGGSQRHTRHLAEYLARYEDLEVTVIHPHKQNVFAPESGVKEIRVDLVEGGVQYLFDSYALSKNMMAAIRQLPDDTIIYGQCLAVWAGLREIRERFVFNPHGLEPYQALGFVNKLKYLPIRLVYSHLFRRSRHIVSLGGRLTGIIRAVASSKAKIHLLPNAIETRPPVGKKFTSPFKLLFVGRHFSNKGIQYLAEAGKLLNEQGQAGRFQLEFVGGGPLLDELRMRYTADNIVFHGRQSDEFLENKLQEADLFVFPTLFEGMPTVVMEAMSYGTPIAVTDTGATLELLGGNNGYLLEKKSPESIGNTILRFMQLSPEAKVAMGQASRERVEAHFTWEAVAAAHREVLTQVHASVPPNH